MKRNHNSYNLCSCGNKKRNTSSRCRKCFYADKASLTKHFKRIGFQEGYTPWNKGVKGKMCGWGDKEYEKKAAFIKEHGGPMKGKKHSDATRRKMSVSHLGELAPNWQGGITPLNTARRHSVEHKIWCDLIFKRDDFTCMVCLKRGGRLEPHHIRPWRSYKELQFEVRNGITLCIPCHRKTTNREEKLFSFFEEILIKCDSKNRVNSGNLLEQMEKILRQS